MVWLHEGELRPVNTDALGELIRMHMVAKHLQRGAEGWRVEYRPVEPDGKTIQALLTEKPSVRSLRLIDRVANRKAPTVFALLSCLAIASSRLAL